MNTYSRAALLAGVEFKRVRVIRTQEGARRYGKPIGSIIGGNGQHHEHLSMDKGVFKGFETVRGKDGVKYDVGYDESTGKWVATVHNSWNDVAAGKNEDEVYHNLNAHVGGKIAPKKPATPVKKPSAKAPKKPAAAPAPAVPTPAKPKPSTRKLTARQARAIQTTEQLREAGGTTTPLGEMSHDELVKEARAIATHLAGNPKSRPAFVEARLRNLNKELNYRKRITQAPKGGTSTGPAPYEVISKNSKAKSAKLRYKDHMYAVQRRGGGLPGWDITDEHGNVTKSNDGISPLRGATRGPRESEAALRSGLENAHATRTVRQEVLNPEASAAADTAKARRQVQKDVQSGRLVKTKPGKIQVGDVVVHPQTGKNVTVGSVVYAGTGSRTAMASHTHNAYSLYDTEGREITSMSPNHTIHVDHAQGRQKVDTNAAQDALIIRGNSRQTARIERNKTQARLNELRDSGAITQDQYSRRVDQLNEIHANEQARIEGSTIGDLRNHGVEPRALISHREGIEIAHAPKERNPSVYENVVAAERNAAAKKRKQSQTLGDSPRTIHDGDRLLRLTSQGASAADIRERAQEHVSGGKTPAAAWRAALGEAEAKLRATDEGSAAEERARNDSFLRRQQDLADARAHVGDMTRVSPEDQRLAMARNLRRAARNHQNTNPELSAALHSTANRVGAGQLKYDAAVRRVADLLGKHRKEGQTVAQRYGYSTATTRRAAEPATNASTRSLGTSMQAQVHNSVDFLKRMIAGNPAPRGSQEKLDNAANFRRLANHLSHADEPLAQSIHRAAGRYEAGEWDERHTAQFIREAIHRANERAMKGKSLQFKAPVITPGGRVGDDAKLGSRANGTNWVERTAPGNTGSLPSYIRIVRNALIKHGKDESSATAIAVATIKRWARGGGNVSPKVRAAAAAALAQWEAMKAKSRVSGKSMQVKKLPKSEECTMCHNQATKRVLHAEGMAYQAACDDHLEKVKQDLGGPDEVSGVHSIADYNRRHYPDKRKRAISRARHVAAANL